MIPVGVGDIDVTEIGRELRQFPSNIEASAIPFDKSTGRETVTKILESWSTTRYLPVVLRADRIPMAQDSWANVLRVALGAAVGRPVPRRRRPRSPRRAIKVDHAVLHSARGPDGSIVDRHEAGLSELRLPNRRERRFRKSTSGLLRASVLPWAAGL